MIKKKTAKALKLKTRNALQKKEPLKRSKAIKKLEDHKTASKKPKVLEKETEAFDVSPKAFREINVKFVDESKGKALTAEGWKRLFKRLNS